MTEDPEARGLRGYDPSDPQSIWEFGLRIKRCSAREICARAGKSDPSGGQPGWKIAKNVLGDVMEWYYGIPKNNSPEPDFPEAGVELKTLPLKRTGTGLRIKEPTSIGMIDYKTLPGEAWERASVHKKLDQILFVFFVINPEDQMGSVVREVLLWRPATGDNAIFRVDWTRTRDLVAANRAYLLSESQARALAARRKGSGGAGERGSWQPGSPLEAKSRAWALKSAFTRQVFGEKVLQEPYDSAFDHVGADIRAAGFEQGERRILERLRRFNGVSVAAIAEDARVPIGTSKNLAASIVKHALGFRNVHSHIREFDQMGIDVKTLNLRRADGFPFEAVSFPVVDLKDLPYQDWEGTEESDGTIFREGSDLATQLHRILFVPTYSTQRKGPQRERRLGTPFFWSPSHEELEGITREWRLFQREVSEGKAKYDLPCGQRHRKNELTPASKTDFIHMRPHGRNSCDEYLDPLGNKVTKQCFWLNKKFVWRLVKENDAFPPPPEDDSQRKLLEGS
jgi:DNA mismatch repair protein MutH